MTDLTPGTQVARPLAPIHAQILEALERMAKFPSSLLVDRVWELAKIRFDEDADMLSAFSHALSRVCGADWDSAITLWEEGITAFNEEFPVELEAGAADPRQDMNR